MKEVELLNTLDLDISLQTGYAIEKKADVIINSANGFLMLGSSGAGAIRKASRKLTKTEKEEYDRLFHRLPEKIQRWYLYEYKKHHYMHTRAQLSSLKLLHKRPKKEYKRGEAVLDTTWSEKSKKKIIHAIGMTYKLTKTDHTRVPGTPRTIQQAMQNAFKIAKKLKAKSIALPVMAARKSYGVHPSQSLRAILNAMKTLEKSSVKKAIICFDNKETRAYLKTLRKELKR